MRGCYTKAYNKNEGLNFTLHCSCKRDPFNLNSEPAAPLCDYDVLPTGGVIERNTAPIWKIINRHFI